MKVSRLRDGREVRTIEREHRGDYVQLHTSPHQGEWLWSWAVSVGTSYTGALPFPNRPHQPPAASEGEALQRAAEAALGRLNLMGKAPRALRAWLEERLAASEQPALFEVTT